MTHAKEPLAALDHQLFYWLAEEKREGRRLAAEAEALREWARLQQAQLLKLQKRITNRARLRKSTARIAKLKDALEKWDKASPSQVGSH